MEPMEQQEPQEISAVQTEAPESPESVEVSTTDSPINWEDVSTYSDDGDDGSLVEGAVEVLPESQKPEEAQPQVEEPSLPDATKLTPEPIAREVPTAEVPQVPPQTQPAPQQPAVDPRAWEAQQLGELTKLYGLSDEDSQAMMTEPEVVLPKVAAQLHLNVLRSVLGAVQSVVPQMIQQQQQVSSAEQQAKSAFFAVHPDLAQPQYEQAIIAAGQIFRQVNPAAPKEMAIQRIGELARVALGLTAQAVAAPVQQSQAAPQQPKPFTPSRGSGGNGVPAPAPTIWEQMALSDDD